MFDPASFFGHAEFDLPLTKAGRFNFRRGAAHSSRESSGAGSRWVHLSSEQQDGMFGGFTHDFHDTYFSLRPKAPGPYDLPRAS
ncbi:hypothetical protein T484DRAFT_1871670 [Baffinella frigidus]|nr:hypothetical protein T484DRAFT_1871670 [Cryptophyta sp. CCMP2293]